MSHGTYDLGHVTHLGKLHISDSRQMCQVTHLWPRNIFCVGCGNDQDAYRFIEYIIIDPFDLKIIGLLITREVRAYMTIN